MKNIDALKILYAPEMKNHRLNLKQICSQFTPFRFTITVSPLTGLKLRVLQLLAPSLSGPCPWATTFAKAVNHSEAAKEGQKKYASALTSIIRLGHTLSFII